MNAALVTAVILIGGAGALTATAEYRLWRQSRKGRVRKARLGWRLQLRRWRLRHQPVCGDGAPLSDAELHAWITALYSYVLEPGPEVAAFEREIEIYMREGAA